MSDTLGVVLWLVAALVGLGFSAVYSGLETGIYCLNHIRLRLRSESGQRRPRSLFRLMRNQRSLLGTLLLGNNIANYLGSSAVVGVCGYTALTQWQIVLVVPLVLSPLLVVFGEIVPKSIFQAYPDRYTYSFVPLLRWSRAALTWTGLLPLVNALTAVLMRLLARRQLAEDENLYHPRHQVGRLIAESSHQGALTPYQSFLVDRVMNLRSSRVAQVMVPIARVRGVPRDISRADFLDAARAHGFSRVVAWGERPADALGVINVNAVLVSTDADRPPAAFVYDVPRLRPDSPVVHALFTLQRARRAMGIVVDRRNAVGIVTIKDLVEEIVGEIEEW